MKAYHIQEIAGEGMGAIVFHESPGKARAFALSTVEWFEWCEWLDLSVKREKRADKFSTEDPSVMDFCSNADFFHSIDWTCYSSGDCDSYSCPFKKDEDEPFNNKEACCTSANMA